MRNHHNQGQFIPVISHHRISKQKRSIPRDRFFHLPTVLAVNDPFLRRLYSAVSYVLDDHPYPSTPKEFHHRTHEIKHEIRNLTLSPDQHQFLQRLMKETGVTLVNFFSKKKFFVLFFISGRSLARFSYHYTGSRLSI